MAGPAAAELAVCGVKDEQRLRSAMRLLNTKEGQTESNDDLLAPGSKLGAQPYILLT